MSRTSALSYAVRPRVVLKYFGQLCLAQSMLVAVAAVVSVSLGDFEFAWRVAVIAAAFGLGGWLLSSLRATREVAANEVCVLTVLSFGVGGLAMSFPMMAADLSFVDALFESISGITTTGLTTITDIEAQSRSMQFTRAWMQWYGGLGFIILTLGLLRPMGEVSRRLVAFEEEARDPVGGVRAHARRVILVYSILTVLGLVVLWLAGAEPAIAPLYILSSVSTGGFSPFNNSLEGLGSRWQQATVLLFSFAGAVSMVVYHRARRESWQAALRDVQLRGLLVCSLMIVILFGVLLQLSQPMAWDDLAWHAVTMGVSAQTTTGFSTMGTPTLAAGPRLVLLMGMFLGGSVGSTAGGFKILRLLIILSLVSTIIRRSAMPQAAVVQPRLHGRSLTNDEICTVFMLLSLFLVVIVVSWLTFVGAGHNPFDSLFEVISAVGTVGLSSGLSAGDISPGLKLVLCADMLMGRLEIFPWIILLYPASWIGKRAEAI